MLTKLDQIVEEENESESESESDSESESEVEHDLENPSALLKDKECDNQQNEDLDDIYGVNTRVDGPADISDEDDAPVGSLLYIANARKRR